MRPIVDFGFGVWSLNFLVLEFGFLSFELGILDLGLIMIDLGTVGTRQKKNDGRCFYLDVCRCMF